MGRTIEVTVKDGKVHMEAQGFKGKACEAATNPYRQALNPDRKGDKVTTKPEYNVSQQTEVER